MSKMPEPTLQGVWNHIAELLTSGAVHRRKRFKLGKMVPEKILHRCGEELLELATAADPENSLEEFGDLLACLFHFGLAKGWTEEQVCREIYRKLRLRIKTKKGKTK